MPMAQPNLDYIGRQHYQQKIHDVTCDVLNRPTVNLRNISVHSIVIPVQSMHANMTILSDQTVTICATDITDEIRKLTTSGLLEVFANPAIPAAMPKPSKKISKFTFMLGDE